MKNAQNVGTIQCRGHCTTMSMKGGLYNIPKWQPSTICTTMQHRNGKVSVDSNNVNGIRKLSSRQVQQMIWFPFNLPIKEGVHRTMREAEIDIWKLDFCFDFVQNGSLFRFIFRAKWILCKYRADETKVRVPHNKQQRPNSGRDIFIYSCLKISKNCFFLKKSSLHFIISSRASEPAFLTSLESFNHLLTPLTSWQGW